nr:hypothetical protein [Elizabethkingia sp. ASV34]
MSRGLGDVYKRQAEIPIHKYFFTLDIIGLEAGLLLLVLTSGNEF